MSTTAVKGLIFDLGKTIMYFPKEFDLGPRGSSLLNIPERVLDNTIIDIYTRYPNLSASKFIDLLCERVNALGDKDISVALRQICDEYMSSAKLQEDALPALEVLKSRNFKITLVSNTTPLTRVCIEQLELEHYFDHIVFSCDIGIMKPDPRMFLSAMNLMGIRPEETCIVGDRIRTIVLGGAILGARTVLVERRMEETVVSKQLPVEAVVPNLIELVNLPLVNGLECD